MSDYIFDAQTRQLHGTGASRRLRREGKIPAVLYGDGKQAVALTLDHDTLLHATEHENFFASVLTLKVDGKKQEALIKDLQRHPFKPKILHADFVRVSATKEVHVHVPLHFIGEDVAPGAKAGGVISHMANEVEVICLAKNLPEFLDVDLSEVQMDGVVHLSDIKLPEGVRLAALSHGEDSHDTSIAAIHEPRKVEEPVAASDADEAADGTPAEDKAADADADSGQSEDS